jgi:hypothetical protein
MRYFALWLGAAFIIYLGFLDIPSGPDFAFAAAPVYSGVLSSLLLLLALLIGLPGRLPFVSRVWHQTPVGIVAVGASIIAGVVIAFVYVAAPRPTISNGVLGLCGLLAIEFAIIHFPERKA